MQHALCIWLADTPSYPFDVLCFIAPEYLQSAVRSIVLGTSLHFGEGKGSRRQEDLEEQRNGLDGLATNRNDTRKPLYEPEGNNERG